MWPALLSAQFQPPNPDELTMTIDPEAKGAAAVFLEIRESDNDVLHERRYYARIKVLTDRGKELATIRLPYVKGGTDFKIVDVQGRTIHSDGTVVSLAVKPEDLLVAKNGEEQIQQKVFTLPDVDVGSVLEYSYELTYDPQHVSSPIWEVQQHHFVHKAHYDFTPFRGFLPGARDALNAHLVDSSGNVLDHLVWNWRLPSGVTVSEDPALGRFSLDVSDVPPVPKEAWMPPDSSTVYKVEFYYTNGSSAEDFWAQAAKTWSRDIDRFAEPTKTIEEAVAGLISASDSEAVKAQKLYAAVQSLDNSDYSRRKSESERKELKLTPVKRAEDTWKEKSGNSNEIALLYLSMLRAAGLTAYATSVVDRSRGVFDPSYMNLDQLDDTLVILNTDGKDVLLDPGQKLCPFQTVNWRHSGAEGLRQSANGPGRAQTPYQVFEANTVKRTGDIEVGPDGTISGTLQIVMTGQDALAWRQRAIEVDDDELKKEFDRDLESITPETAAAHVDHFLGLDEPDKLLMAVVKVSGSLGTLTAKRMVMPGFFFETRETEPFVKEKDRLEPVDMHYASQVSDQLTYHLPDGSTIEGAPPDTKVAWENHALYIVKSKADPGQITIARVLARAFTLAKPEEYQDLRGFYQKVSDADQGQLVVDAGASPKGN